MLVTSIFSFSHNVFNPVKDKKYIFFVFDWVENIVGKGYFLSLTGLKTLWEKEKMLVTSIFSFSSAKAFNLDQTKILPFGKGLKKFKQTMDKRTGHRGNITEIKLKMALNTTQSINHVWHTFRL